MEGCAKNEAIVEASLSLKKKKTGHVFPPLLSLLVMGEKKEGERRALTRQNDILETSRESL
jgi:hypothetical protein